MSIETALELHAEQQGADRAVAQLVSRAARVPGFARRLGSAGLDPRQLTGLADLALLPIVTKDEMIVLQREDPPWAGMLDPDARVQRMFQSPGPLYEPQLLGADWRWGQALATMGIDRRDVVLNCFGHHLSPAGAMMEQGAHSMGAATVPGGIGNQELQVQAIADLEITAFTGLPTYLKSLVDRYETAGHPASRWRLGKALVTAEPLPEDLRLELQRRIPMVRMAYGTGETGLLAYENGDGEGLALANGVLVQVCDLETGEPVTDDSEGQVVVTLLRPDYPLVRFGTGDLSGWMLGSDGTPRLRGVLGRVGAAVKVKGMFLHPVQVASVMTRIKGIADYQFVISRENHMDALRCEILAESGVDTEGLIAEVEERVREGLRFNATVVTVSAAELTPDHDVLVDTRDLT